MIKCSIQKLSSCSCLMKQNVCCFLGVGSRSQVSLEFSSMVLPVTDTDKDTVGWSLKSPAGTSTVGTRLVAVSMWQINCSWCWASYFRNHFIWCYLLCRVIRYWFLLHCFLFCFLNLWLIDLLMHSTFCNQLLKLTDFNEALFI